MSNATVPASRFYGNLPPVKRREFIAGLAGAAAWPARPPVDK